MRTRGLITAVLGAAIALLALAPGPVLAQRCGGLLQPACPPPAPAPPPPPAQPEQATIALSPERIERNIRSSPVEIRYEGRVTGVGNPGRLVVELEVRSPDYDTLLDDRFTVTEDDGTFVAKVESSLNADVRAYIRPRSQEGGRLVEGVSPAAKIVVQPKRPKLRIDPVGRRSVRFELSFGGPLFVKRPNASIAPRPGPAKRGYFYAIPKGSKTARRIGSAPFRTRDCTGFCFRSARKTFRITPRLVAASGFLACTRDDVWLGIGEGSTYRNCGRPRLRV